MSDLGFLQKIINCENNKICVAEGDAKRRGAWFFQISFLATKPVKLGSMQAQQTVASGEFEVLQFAPTFEELDYYEEGEDHQVDWQGRSVYNKLNLIHSGETMAFVKLKDSFSVPLADALREHRPVTEIKFGLKKYSRRGGITHQFGFEMNGVFILDIKLAGAAEKYLVTFSKSRFEGSMSAK
jgi:hypothetical protein